LPRAARRKDSRAPSRISGGEEQWGALAGQVQGRSRVRSTGAGTPKTSAIPVLEAGNILELLGHVWPRAYSALSMGRKRWERIQARYYTRIGKQEDGQ